MAKEGKSLRIPKHLPLEQSCLVLWDDIFPTFVNLVSTEKEWSSLTFGKAVQDKKNIQNQFYYTVSEKEQSLADKSQQHSVSMHLHSKAG